MTEPGIKVAFADGNRDLVLEYRSHRITGNGLTIELPDILGHLPSPRGTPPASLPARLPPLVSRRRQQAEFGFDQQPVGRLLAALESRGGGTSNHMSPWFAIDQKGMTSEERGPVWFGTLAWGGSWRISVGTDLIGRVRIAGGYNPNDFS